jgi:hypothetical protein
MFGAYGSLSLLTQMCKVNPVIFAPHHVGGGGIALLILNLGSKMGEIRIAYKMLVGIPLKQSTSKIQRRRKITGWCI